MEVNGSDGPTRGDEQVASDDDVDFVLMVRDNDGGGEGVQREVDLSACISSRLSFDYRRDSLVKTNQYVEISVSSDAGASWTAIVRYSGPSNDVLYQHFSYNITENPVEVFDLNATILHQLGIDHKKLTYRFQGRDYRLTDIHGKVVEDILV